MKKRHIITLMLCLLALWGKPHRVAAQFFSAKVNALAALTATVNVGVDAAVADKWTLDLSAYWNPVNTAVRPGTSILLRCAPSCWNCPKEIGRAHV